MFMSTDWIASCRTLGSTGGARAAERSEVALDSALSRLWKLADFRTLLVVKNESQGEPNNCSTSLDQAALCIRKWLL